MRRSFGKERDYAHEKAPFPRNFLPLAFEIAANNPLGFSLYMIRAVLSGRDDEVINLATTNLMR